MAVMMMALVPDYGRRIRLRRQALGMSQKQLAARVGKSESAVISWEKQRHEPNRTQGALEDVLGISLSEPEPDVDPAEAEFRATLERLRAAGHEELEGGGLERVMDAIRAERARHRNSAAKRAG